MTRSQMLVSSAAAGLIVGLLLGVTALAALTLVAHVVPGLADRLVERLRGPVLVLLLVVVPVAAAVLGYFEGRGKLP
jgi:ABC-type methionine transport system permease subunit